jgi:hypothetical protein
MNTAENKKLTEALDPLAQMAVELTEFPARAKATADYWAGAAAQAGDAAKKKSAAAAAAALTDLVKNSKVVLKDISPIMEGKRISAYAGTAKEYRDKVMPKRLASAKAFDLNAQRLIAHVVTIENDPFKFRPKQDPPSKVNLVKTMDHLRDFSYSYNELRIRLAKL